VAAIPLAEAVCRDPDDDHILALAATAGAEVIVSGDDDLLSLKRHHGVDIVSPRAFWDRQRDQ
jgi:predicted nucleic acid-binding protein